MLLTFVNRGSTLNGGVKIFKQSASNSLILTHSELGWCSFPYLKFRSWWQAGLFLTSKVAEKSHGNSLSRKDDKVGPCRLTSFLPRSPKTHFLASPITTSSEKETKALSLSFWVPSILSLVLNHHRNYQSQVRIRCHTWHSGPLRFSNLPCLADFTWLTKLLHESKIFFLWKKMKL